MIIFIGVLSLSLIGFFIHIYFTKETLTKARIIELLLLYQLVFSIGLTSLLAFYGLTFMTEYVAAYSGWPICPFEKLLGNVNLSFGVLGILCIWLRGNFWIATALGFSVWIFADGISHLLDMVYNHNLAPGNIGIPLITDLLVPTVVMILLALHLKYPTNDQRF